MLHSACGVCCLTARRCLRLVQELRVQADLELNILHDALFEDVGPEDGIPQSPHETHRPARPWNLSSHRQMESHA